MHLARVGGLWLTATHVASIQPVTLVTGAAVATHGVVALMVTPSVCVAALINICIQDDNTVNMDYRKIKAACVLRVKAFHLL